MSSRSEKNFPTSWQTVQQIASSREGTKSGRDFLTKNADRVIEHFYDAEIELLVEEAVRTMFGRGF